MMSTSSRGKVFQINNRMSQGITHREEAARQRTVPREAKHLLSIKDQYSHKSHPRLLKLA
jgi:hypothetical protein